MITMEHKVVDQTQRKKPRKNHNSNEEKRDYNIDGDIMNMFERRGTNGYCDYLILLCQS